MNPKLWFENNQEDIISLRRYLHSIPEIGFNEFKTSKHIMNLLSDIGFSIRSNAKMQTGFYCELGSNEKNILAIRCDMDGLDIDEDQDIDYKSINKGCMHACGHDVHMAILYTLAKYLSEIKLDFPGKIRFIFQPAEEQAPGGAEAMIEGGAIESVNKIIGFHVFPKLEADSIGIKSGDMTASVDLVNIELSGPGGHTSRPEETVDLISAQSYLIQELSDTFKNNDVFHKNAVLAFGNIHGGGAHNVLPTSIKIKGTLRYSLKDIQNDLHESIDAAINKVSEFTGADISWEIQYSSPGVFNDLDLTDMVIDSAKSSIGDDKVVILKESSMGAEDFAHYLNHIPGAYFRVGCFDGKSKDIHLPNFNVDEECLKTGFLVLEKFVSKYFS